MTAESGARPCTHCISLVHYWSAPTSESVELPITHERFSFLIFRCVCQCRCSAVMTTVEPDVERRAPSTNTERAS